MEQSGSFRYDVPEMRVIVWSESGCAVAKAGQAEDGGRFLAEEKTPEQAADAVAQSGVPAVVGFPIHAGSFSDGRLRWLREQPREPFSVAELRTMLREAEAEAIEAIRRGGRLSSAVFVGSTMLKVRIDGRRALNPVGFPGRAVAVHARSTFLTDDAAARFLSRACERNGAQHNTSRARTDGGAGVLPILFDDAAIRILDPSGRAIVLLLDRNETSVCALRDGALVGRSVIAFGQESATGRLARLFDIAQQEEAERMLVAASEGRVRDAFRREIEAALAPVYLAWASAVRDAITRTSMKTEAPVALTVVYTGTLRPPFQRAFHPRTLRRALAPLRVDTITVASLAEAAGCAPQTEEMFVRLYVFTRAAALGQFFAA